MLRIGKKFPEFKGKAVKGLDAKTAIVDFGSENLKGKWSIVFFYPKDFTFVCPTEIKGFADLNNKFNDRDAQILAVSTDNEFVHLAWKQSHKDLQELPFAMYSDITRKLSSDLGILDEEEGVAQRATYIVDPEGIIRFIYVTDLSVGRNPSEVLRVLDGLQSDELCPCNWEKGQATL